MTRAQLLLFLSLLLTAYAKSSTVDQLNVNFLSNLIESFRGPNKINVTQFLSTFSLPACMKQCLPEIDGLLVALSKSNDTQDMAEICSELQSSTSCASSVGCSKIFTDAAASAFQFVCLDNIQSIAETMECVKEAALDIQPECEAHCEVQAKMIEDASNNNMEAIFEVPRVCNSTRCLLTCFKEKIDKKCQLGQQNLLDTLLNTVTRGGSSGLDEALGWVMPDYCKGNNSTKISNSTSSDKPLSVGKVSSGAKKPKTVGKTKTEVKAEPTTVKTPTAVKSPGKADAVGATETTLLVNGEIRTLRYQLLDWQGNPVPSPDSETLTRLMTQQFLPGILPPDHPKGTVIFLRAGGDREKNTTAPEDDQGLDVINEEEPDWRSEDGPEVFTDDGQTKEGVGLAIGLVVFVATAMYWMWELARDFH
ncbi:hypothetical protein Y032_0019g3901 [Ancylostoma ceylanicum]|uniref:Chondroitin proteoglycan 4 domain-containing protein n=1 Tax=Ancylostoma ceylanicum TaxID=53326 RepID=A0A016V2V8_9BILA|nr:hypothetical protein Y032_0019g3901 [Ancylostoma ceylanicum]